MGRHWPILSLISLFAVAALGVASAGEGATAGRPPGPAIRFVEDEQGVVGTALSVFLSTTSKKAWKALRRPNGARLFSHVKSIRPLDERLWEYRLDSMVGENVVCCAVRVDDEKRTLSWRRVSGDLAAFRGHYRLREAPDYPGYVRADYVNYVDPGGLVGMLFTNDRRRKAVLEMIPRLRHLVR